LRLAQQPSIKCGNKRLIEAAFAAHPAGPKEPQEYVNAVRTFNVSFSMAIRDLYFAISMEQIARIEAALRQQLGFTPQYSVKALAGPKTWFYHPSRSKEDRGN
jgi:hypothetical protein